MLLSYPLFPVRLFIYLKQQQSVLSDLVELKGVLFHRRDCWKLAQWLQFPLFSDRNLPEHNLRLKANIRPKSCAVVPLPNS